MEKVDDIVKKSLVNSSSFPELSVIMNAISQNNELCITFKRNLINRYVKEDDDLLQIVKLMSNKNFEFDKFDIFDLAKNGFFKTMKYFENLGFDLNIKDENNENALFYVIQRDISRYNDTDLWWRTEDYIINIVENCVNMGIDEKVINIYGRNLYHAFVTSGMPIKYFDALINYEIDINHQDINGWTPLHFACAYYSDLNLYKKMLKYGADKTILTVNHVTNFAEDYDVDLTPKISSAYDLALHQISQWGGWDDNAENGYEDRKKLITDLEL